MITILYFNLLSHLLRIAGFNRVQSRRDRVLWRCDRISPSSSIQPNRQLARTCSPEKRCIVQLINWIDCRKQPLMPSQVQLLKCLILSQTLS